MSAAALAVVAADQRISLDDIVLDPQLRDLLPPPAPEEQAALEEALHRDGCGEPLIVWRCQGRLVLVVGYEQFPTLKSYKLSCDIVEKEFATREEAEFFLIKHRLARQNLAPLAVSYLRGLHYQGEKRPHGGDRRSAHAERRGKTAEALAEFFHVAAATIRQDAAVAVAVNRIADNCDGARGLLLSRAARLTRHGLLCLAKLKPEEQRARLALFRERGRWPRPGKGEGKTITLPVEVTAAAETLIRRRGEDYAAELMRAVAVALEQAQAIRSEDTNGGTPPQPPHCR